MEAIKKYNANINENFRVQNIRAKEGERIGIDSVEKILAPEPEPKFKIKSPYKIVDVSEDDKYQKNDIDILMYKFSLCKREYIYITSFEIKTDFIIHKTNNIFAETQTQRDNGHNTTGWLYKSKADFLLYYDPYKNVFYQTDLNVLKEYVANNINTLTYKKVYNKKEKGYNCGYLVNLSKLNYDTFNTYELYSEELLYEKD